MKAKRLKYLVQKKMNNKTPGSTDFMNRHVESLIEVIAPMIENKVDIEIERQKRKELRNIKMLSTRRKNKILGRK